MSETLKDPNTSESQFFGASTKDLDLRVFPAEDSQDDRPHEVVSSQGNIR